MEPTDIIGKTLPFWVPADDDVDIFMKGQVRRDVSELERRLTDIQLAWIDRLRAEHRIEKCFNIAFFTSWDSREPELAGIWVAVMGSSYTLAITLIPSLPMGVVAAVYLEEFAPKNRWTDLIEVNISNLAETIHFIITGEIYHGAALRSMNQVPFRASCARGL